MIMANTAEEEGDEVAVAKKYVCIKIGIVYFCMASFGLSMSMIGPSIPDLCERMTITTEQIGLAMSISGILSSVLSVISGTLLDRYQHHIDLILGIYLSVIGLSTILIPFATSLGLFTLLITIYFISIVAMDQVSNVSIFSLWGKKATPYMMALHTCWGIGFAVGPLMLRPFLGPDRDVTEFNRSLDTYITNSTANDISRIEIPYSISGILVLVSSIMAFVLYSRPIPSGVNFHLKPIESIRNMFVCCDKKDKKIPPTKVLLMIFFFMYYFWNCGKEWTFNTWLFTYAVDSGLGFTKKEAALLDSAAQFSFLIGRVLATAITLKMPIQIAIFAQAYIVLGMSLCLHFLATQHKIYLWVFSCLFNVFSAPMWPTGLAWTNRYIEISGQTMILLNMGAGLSNFVFPYIAGWIFTNKSPDNIMYIYVITAAIMAVQVVCMQITASFHGSRFPKQEDKELKDLIDEGKVANKYT